MADGQLPPSPFNAGVPLAQVPIAGAGDLAAAVAFLIVTGSGGTAQVKRVALTGAQALVGSGIGTPVPPANAVAVGAAGLVLGVTQIPNADGTARFAYTSNVEGQPLPYVSRADLPIAAQVLNSTSRLRVIFAYGGSAQTIPISIATDLATAQAAQSTASAAGNVALAAAHQAHVTLLQELLELASPQRVFKFCDSTRTPVPQIGITQPTTQDIIGCTALSPYNPVGTIYAICRQLFAARDLKQIEPILMLCASKAGASIQDLLPTGATAWAAQLNQIGFAASIATKYGLTPFYESVLLIEDCGVSTPVGSHEPYLTQLMAAYDALALNGSGGAALGIFIDESPPDTSHSFTFPAVADQRKFATDNPARVSQLGPRYDVPFQDSHHFNSIGAALVAERDAHIAHRIENGLGWLGDLHMAAIYLQAGSGTSMSVTIDYSELLPGQFIPLVLDGNLATTGFDTQGQWGFRALTAAGAFLGITGLALVPGSSRVTGTIAGTLAIGDKLSMAMYGQVSVAGTASGVFGNLRKQVDAGVISPGLGISMWATCEEIVLTSANFAAAPPIPAILGISLSNTAIAANQSGVRTVGTITATTQGAVGAITFSLQNTAGVFSVSGNTISAAANVDGGNYPLIVVATAGNGAVLSQLFNIVAS